MLPTLRFVACSLAGALLLWSTGCKDKVEQEDRRLARGRRAGSSKGKAPPSTALDKLISKATLPKSSKGSKGANEAPASTGPKKLEAPKQKPHPDYPTQAKAKTDKIFLLEEPNRGPVVEAPALPVEKSLRFTTHLYCSATYGDVVCGSKKRAGGAREHYRVGRDKKRRIVMVEKRFGPRIEARYVFTRDAGGKLTAMTKLDRFGVARWSRSFDATGTRYYERRRSGANRLAGCGRVALERDAKGRAKRASCLQWSGAPMKDAGGVYARRITRDKRGLVVAVTFEDRKGAPMTRHDGVHKVSYKRDKAGRVIERRSFDKQGFAVLSAKDEGCHGWIVSYDKRGLEEGKRCVGADGKPAKDTEGSCRFLFEYDGRGCHVGTRSFALDNDGGCTRVGRRYRYAVGPRCGRLQKICLSSGGTRLSCGVREPAEYRYTRDAKGDVIATKHFAVSGAAGKDPECGVFEERLTRDGRGNITGKAYFDASGRPVICSRTGFHALRHKVDAAGRNIEKRFVNVDGSPGTNLGTALRKLRFDNYDHFVEARNYNASGALHPALGSAIQRRIYDQGHRLFGVLLYDNHRKPARYRGCYTGRTCPDQPWHAMRVVREPNGSVSRNLFFDREGQLIRTVLCERARCWK